MQQTNELWPGWKTIRAIGTGSFGTVYEIARDVFGTDEHAALKVIRIPQNDTDVEELQNEGYDDESITARFQSYLEDIVREYSTMVKMKGHTNVVYCDDIRYIQHENGFGWDIFIKMELLLPMMKNLQKVNDEREVIRLGVDICNALTLCKRFNVIHRDIKPQNIFLSQDGNYKLGDFGIAKTAERTMSGTKIGTYKYMAPEVYNNKPYGASADIYSLGLVMYWLLNDRRTPFLPEPPKMATAIQEEESKQRRFNGEPIPLPRHGSKELQDIVLKACAFRPEDRYASAEEMRWALLQLPGYLRQEQAMSEKTIRDVSSAAVITPVAAVAAADLHKPLGELDQISANEKTEFISQTEKTELASATERTEQLLSTEETLKLSNLEMTELLEASAPADIAVPEKPEQENREKKKRLVPLICAGAAVLALILLSILLFTKQHRRPEQNKKREDSVSSWSDWTEKLPDDITEDKYQIEERTLYRSRNLETTSSEKEKMDGWECYDVVDGTGEFGNWTDWTETKPAESADREIETANRYRYRDKETTTSEQTYKDGWERGAVSSYKYDDYGAWSSWQSSAVSSSEEKKVETKTQYRSRSISTTNSYSDWSGWSGWQTARESTGDTKKEETRTVYGYYYYRCPSCGAHMAESGTCATWAGGCGAAITGANYVSFWSATSWGSAGMSSWYGSSYQYAYVEGALSFSSGGTATQYRYATRTVNSQTTYGSWSAWTDNRASASSTLEVQTRTMYRYCTRQKTPVYTYTRWGAWSQWSDSEIKQNSNRQVETKTVYRSRDKVYEKTYYFRRWTDWTEFSKTPVSADDNTEVETKTEYRYILK